MAPRDERVGKNQVLFREVNERIEEATTRAAFDGPTVFVCECGSEQCSEPLELTLAQYEAIRAHPTHFAILRGHEIEDVERVVDEDERFVVVEKLARAGEIAAANDPRSV